MKQGEAAEKTVVDFARKYYRRQDFAHGIEHGKRVVALAERIRSAEGGDRFLVLAGAWLHQLHDDIEVLKRFLENPVFEEKTKERLLEIVQSCKPRVITAESSLEAKIVFDADALEVLGPYGTIREVLCNAAARKKDRDRSVRDARKVQTLCREKLMTKTARKMARGFDKVTNNFWTTYDRWERLEV